MSSLSLSYEGVAAPDAWPISWVPSTCSVGGDDPRVWRVSWVPYACSMWLNSGACSVCSDPGTCFVCSDVLGRSTENASRKSDIQIYNDIIRTL
jgi:hypothetical protein